MNLIRKLAPGRLSRAIVALTAKRGNRALPAAQPDPNKPLNGQPGGNNDATLSQRTTITVETERLLVVRTEQRSLRFNAKSDDKSTR